MALDSIWQPQINSWLSGQPMPVDDFGKPLPPTLAGLVPPPAPTQQAVLGGRPYDPTKLSPPPQQGPAPSPLAAALTGTPTGQTPKQMITGGVPNDALAQALLSQGNSGKPIFSPLELMGRLAQVWSGNAAEQSALNTKRDQDLARRQQLADAVSAAGNDPTKLQSLAISSGDPTVAALATKANTPVTPYTDIGKIDADVKAGRITADEGAAAAARLTSGGRPFTEADRSNFKIAADQAGYMDAQGVPHYLGSSLSGTPSTDDSQAIAKGIASGDIPPTTIGKNSKYNAPVTAILARQGTNLAQLSTDWNATQKFYGALDGTAQVRLRQNIDTLQGTLGTIRTLAEQWNAGHFPLLNTATRQAALQGALGPEANKIAVLLGQQIADVTGEMGSVLMGGNSPTDHALDLAAQNLSADWSYPTLTAALDQFDQNISFRKNAILSSAPADAGNNPYFKPGGGTAASELSSGSASPGSAFSPVTLPGQMPPPATASTGGAVASAPNGADAPPQSYLDAGGTAAGWAKMSPDNRKLFQ